MSRLTVLLASTALLLGAGCAHSTPAPTTPSTSRATSTYTPILNLNQGGACTLTELELDGEAGFLVEGPGGYGVLVPGTPEAWHAECPTADPRMPFYAEAHGDDVVFGVSLEVVLAEADEDFDERAHLAIQAALQGAMNGAEDLGSEELGNGHAAHFTRIERTLEDGTSARSVHGYAARRLDDQHVILLHVSETSDDPSPEHIDSLLALFGRVDELVRR